ncbi:MAG TPA: copper chaperone PCu(A)C [Hyphomonas sp.]|nr:hypothetical protein [Hyphomonas sp.]HRJ01965.1 copper chaperone PCu(A)C [Hyphomonas sp.]HRK69283.1 copper chaperone PCu(A)C [Hyphomonas sp.]
MRILPTLILPAILLLAACGGAETAAPAGGSIADVRDAYIVQPPEGRDITGGGMHVTVQGASLTLIGATTEIADHVELHTMSMDDGVMQMRKVEGFPVSADAPLSLERGGNHLMFYGLQPLEIGDEIDIVLTFVDEDGAEQHVVTKAEVVPIGG